jgi:hypothetical protein
MKRTRKKHNGTFKAKCQRRRENASTGRSKTASRMDAKMPSREGFWCATNRMRSVLPHRRRFPRRRALPNLTKRAPLPQLILRPEPQLPFRFPNQCLLMLALWSCGRRRSVVQAQRQIHRAFTGSYAATYALVTRVTLIRHWRGEEPGFLFWYQTWGWLSLSSGACGWR